MISTLEAVGTREGMQPLSVVLALPRQTTDAWLLWGRDDGDAEAVERLSRHEVKRRVFGEARSGHVDRARQLVPALLERLRSVESTPPSLAMFRKELMAGAGGAAPTGPA